MSAASNYTENNIVNHYYRCIQAPVPTRVYVALHIGNPGDTGSFEVNTTAWPAYVRRDPADGESPDTGWTEPVDGISTNVKQMIFNANNGAAAVTVTHWSVWDAPTGGNLISHAALENPRTIYQADVFMFDAGSLTVQAL